jgi:excisionase family DNA binding protein
MKRTTIKPPTSWEELPLIIDLPIVCRMLGRSYSNVKQMCQDGKIPAFKVGQEWRIDKTALQAWIQAQYLAGLSRTGDAS